MSLDSKKPSYFQIIGVPVVLALFLSTVVMTFQNCGAGFHANDPFSSSSSSSPYGGIPSQGVNKLPPGGKVVAKSSATANGTSRVVTCKTAPCYK